MRALHLFFFNLDSFLSFSSLIAVARTFRTMLNNSGESEHPCLVLNLRGNAFTVSPLRINNVCCGFIIYGFYYTEVFSFYACFLEGLIINGC